jgi:hypothetical protein
MPAGSCTAWSMAFSLMACFLQTRLLVDLMTASAPFSLRLVRANMFQGSFFFFRNYWYQYVYNSGAEQIIVLRIRFHYVPSTGAFTIPAFQKKKIFNPVILMSWYLLGAGAITKSLALCTDLNFF